MAGFCDVDTGHGRRRFDQDVGVVACIPCVQQDYGSVRACLDDLRSSSHCLNEPRDSLKKPGENIYQSVEAYKVDPRLTACS
jgi:hypothetical protein